MTRNYSGIAIRYLNEHYSFFGRSFVKTEALRIRQKEPMRRDIAKQWAVGLSFQLQAIKDERQRHYDAYQNWLDNHNGGDIVCSE